MLVYFAWVKGEEVFNPNQHNRCDEEIFDLEIIEREGEFPLARLKVMNPKRRTFGLNLKNHAFISYKKKSGEATLLFWGRAIGVPQKIDGEIMEITLTAEPENSTEQLKKLHESLKKPPFWDALFVSEKNQGNPTEALEARSALYFWNRKTGEVSLSDFLSGKETLKVVGDFFRESLQISVSAIPLSEVKVRMSVEWLQQYQGVADLTFPLNTAFEEGVVNTFTGPDLQKKWWTEKTSISGPGYKVLESHFEEILPPKTGILNMYPRVSRPFRVSPWEQEEERKASMEASETKQLKRFWYKVSLRLGWKYKQKRKEVLEFTLKHSFQHFSQSAKRTKTLDFNLQDITLADEALPWRANRNYSAGVQVMVAEKVYTCVRTHRSGQDFSQDKKKWKLLGDRPNIPRQSGRSTFFITDRGKQTVEHAIEVARAHLAASARAVDIQFSGGLETLLEVTCDHQIYLKDDRLPGGEAWGKVKAYRISMSGARGEGKVDVTLGCAVGNGTEQKKKPYKKTDGYVEDGYCDEDYQDKNEGFYRTVSGVLYLPYEDQMPQDGLIYPGGLRSRDFIQNITVTNAPAEQETYLQKNQYPHRHNLESVLDEVKTDVKIELLDLRPVGTLEHKISVILPQAWSAPRNIHI